MIKYIFKHYSTHLYGLEPLEYHLLYYSENQPIKLYSI